MKSKWQYVFITILILGGLLVGNKIDQDERETISDPAERKLASLSRSVLSVFSSALYFQSFFKMVKTVGKEKLKLSHEKKYLLEARTTQYPLKALSLIQKDKARLILTLTAQGHSQAYIRSKVFLKYVRPEKNVIDKIPISLVDLNRDGKVDKLDQALVAKEMVQVVPYSYRADFNQDGKTDIWDLLTFNSILSYVSGLQEKNSKD